MSRLFLIRAFIFCFSSLLLLSCSKNNNIDIASEYILEKTRYQEFNKGKIIYDEWYENNIRGNLIFSSNNKVELTYFDLDTEKSSIEIGVNNQDKQTIYFKDFEVKYFYEGKFLVLITEEYIDENGSGDKSLAYFKKNE